MNEICLALLFRGMCYIRNEWKSLVFYTALHILTQIFIVLLAGVDVRKLKTVQTTHEKEIFPLHFKDELLSPFNIKYFYFNLTIFPESEAVREVLKQLKLQHPRVDYHFVTNRREILEDLRNDMFRVIFDNVSPLELRYSIFMKKDWSIFPPIEIPGSYSADNEIISSGHTALQIAIDEAYMATIGVKSKQWKITKNPYPAYSSIPRSVGYNIKPTFVWHVFCFGSFGVILRHGVEIIDEKIKGVCELLAIFGVSHTASYLSWICTHGFILMVIAFIQTAMMVLKIFSRHVLLLHTKFWIVFLVLTNYYLSSLILASLVSSFCPNSTIWILAGSAIWIILILLLRFDNIHSYLLLGFLSMFPPGGLDQFVAAAIEFEKLDEGIHFWNIFTRPPVTYSLLSVGESFCLMLVGLIISLALSIYFDLIIPRKYGQTKPWYFLCPFLRKIPSFKRSKKTFVEEPKSVDIHLKGSESQVDSQVAIEIVDIHKKFGKVEALRGVTMKIYDNKITTLLGHNGSGKTTLLNIINGMLVPTKGKVYSGGLDVFEKNNLEKFRRNIGYCAQNNLLMSYLTTSQHLVFFALLQGNKLFTSKLHSIYWLAQFNMLEKKDVEVLKLSEGMKRKLSLCICLQREPRIMLLDEPTSGLDPTSRKLVWEILSKTKEKASVILTTQLLEEADILSDEVAILSEGKLKIYGSTLFLKNKYGKGYNVSFIPIGDTEKIPSNLLSSLNKHIPSFKINCATDKNLSIYVDANYVQTVLNMVDKTFENKVGLSVTNATLDDVFLRVQEDTGMKVSLDESSLPINNVTETSFDCRDIYWPQFRALIVKRYFWTIHNWTSFLLYAIVWPMGASVCAVFFPLLFNPGIEIGETRLNLKTYGKTDVLISEHKPLDEFSQVVKQIVSSQGAVYHVIDDDQQIVDALLAESSTDLKHYRTQIIFSLDSKEEVPIAYYSCTATFALPIAINIFTNAFIKANNSNSTVKSQIYLQPSLDFDTMHPLLGQMLKGLTFFIFCDRLLEAVSYFLCFPHEERTTFMKHLQLLTGLRSIIYWSSNALFDVLIVLIMIFIVAFTFELCETLMWNERTFTQEPYFDAMLIILLFFMISSISFSYMFHYCYKKEKIPKCLLTYQALPVILYVIFMVLKLIFSLSDNTNFLAGYLKYVFYFIPWIPFYESLRTSMVTLMLMYNDKFSRSDRSFIKETLSDLLAEVRIELIYMSLDAVIYFILVVLIDDGVFNALMKHLKCKPKKYFYEETEEDVLKEQNRIMNLKEDDKKPFVVVNGLTKTYKKGWGAQQITFGVEKGECFGLLGVNGAGKTTTFKLLTGQIVSEEGDAFINGNSLVKARHRYMNNIGYCPQLYGLLEALSAKRLILLFGELRGLRGATLKTTARKWAQILDMDEIWDRNCGTYSGGNQRKLSTALALEGNTRVAILDEPTTGVDPVTRRKLWNVLKHSQDGFGATHIITSHNMDECEALCDRLTIMVDGRMACLGPIGLLKMKYASGFTLLVKLKPTATDEMRAKAIEVINEVFSSGLIEHNDVPNFFICRVTGKVMRWSDRFEAVNKLKHQFSQVDDIILSDTSVEQVFLNVAKKYENNVYLSV